MEEITSSLRESVGILGSSQGIFEKDTHQKLLVGKFTQNWGFGPKQWVYDQKKTNYLFLRVEKRNP